MKKIILEDFILIQIDMTNDRHIKFIKEINNDDLIKKYLFPYNESLEDFIDSKVSGVDIFNNFYIIYYENREVGYIEIENMKNVSLNYALLSSERGNGLDSKLLKELSKYILDNYSDQIESVNTIIRNENEASIHASIKGGFDFIETKDGFTTYSKRR